MTFCIICFFRKFGHSQWQTDLGQRAPFLPEIVAELEDSRKFSLVALTTLLAVLAISGSRVLLPVVLTLLMYTISLRLSINSCFLRNYPALSRFFHVVPLLGTFCTASVALVADSRSNVVATASLLLGALPLATMVIHHGRFCGETVAAALPMQRQDVPVPALSTLADSTSSN